MIERNGILFVMQDDKEVKVQKEVQKWLREIELIK
jgi:hypothetical protein